jgi:hypothetical protein
MRPINAYQLSLLGDAPKPMKAWSPALCLISIFGCPLPPDDDAVRQFKMQHPIAANDPDRFRFGPPAEDRT